MRRALLFAWICVAGWLGPIGAAPQAEAQAPEPPQLQRWPGHEAPLYAIAYSPDGKNVISASVDGSVRIWDRATGATVRRIAAHSSPILSLAVAPDGLTFATGARDGRVRWFELPRWHALADIPGVPGVPNALALAAEGPWLATGDQANIVRVWDANTKQAVRDFGGATGGVTAVGLDVAAKQVFAASGDGVVRVWNLDNAQLTAALAFGPSPALAVSGDGKTMAIAGADGLVRLALWPPTPPQTLVTHNDQAIATAIVAPGSHVVTAGIDNQVHLIQVADGKLVRSFAGQPPRPTALAASADGALVATAAETGVVKLWSVADGADRGLLAGPTGAIAALAFDPQRLRLATAGADGAVRLWRPPTVAAKWGAHGGAVERVASAADAELAVSYGADKAVRLWNTKTGQPARAVEQLPQPITAAALNAQGTRLAWGDSTGSITEQAAADGSASASIGGHSAAVTGLTYDPAGKWFASSGADGLVKVWNWPLAAPQTTAPLAEVPAMLVPAGESELLMAAASGELSIYDWSRQQVARKLPGANQPLTALAARLDGSLAAAGSSTGMVRFWNPSAAQLLSELGAHEGPVTALALHPKEPQLATAGADGLIRLWRVPGAAETLAPRAADGKPLRVPPTALSFDGNLLVVGRGDGVVQVTRAAAPGEARPLTAAKQPISAVAIRRDGVEVAAGDATGQLWIWTAQDGAVVAQIGAHDGTVTGTHYSIGGDRLLTTGDDNVLRLWQLPLAPSVVLGKPAGPTRSLALSSDAQRALTLTDEGQLRAFDAAGGGDAFVTEKLPAAPTALAVAPANDVVAVGDDKGTIRFRSAVDGAARSALGGHDGAVRALAYNPKKAQIASAGDDGKIRLWEPPAPSLALAGHQGKILASALSPNGQLLATGAADKSARLWNLAAANVAWLLGDSADVACVAWKLDGAQVATGNSAKQIRVWNVGDGQQLAILEGHAAALTQLAFLPDGTLVSGSADGQLKFWSVAEKKELATVAAHAKSVTGLAFIPNTTTLASVAADGQLKLWNLADKKPILETPAGAATVALAASPDGKWLVLAGPDKSTRLVAVAGGAAGPALSGLRAPAVAVAFSPDSQRVAAAASDGEVRVWTIAGAYQESVALQPVAPTSLAFAPDGKGLLVGGTDHQIHAVRLAWQKTIDISTQPLTSLAFLPDGEQLLVGGRDKLAAVWNVTSGAAVRALAGPTDAVTAVHVSPDGSKLAAVGVDKVARLWNAADGAAIWSLPQSAALRDVRISRDGMKVALASDDGATRVLELATGRLWQWWREGASPVIGVAWSADPRVLLATTADGATRRLTLSALAALQPEGGARGVALLPNGQGFAAWNNDKQGRVWTITGQAGPVLAGPEGALISIAARPDGAQFAGVAADKQLYFWNAGNGQLERKTALSATPTHVAYAPDQSRVVVACDDGGVRVVQVADGKLLEVIAGRPGIAATAAWLAPAPPQPNQPPAPDQVLVSHSDGQVDVRRPAFLRALVGHQGPVVDLLWSADGSFVFSSGSDKTVRQWTAANGQAIRGLPGAADVVTGLALVAGGTRVAGGSLDKNLRLWNVADGGLVATTPSPTPLRKTVATRDDTAVATMGDDGMVRLWDAATGKELERWASAPSAVPLAATTKRGTLVALPDKTMKLYASSLARLIVADAAAVQSLAVTPDGQHLITSGNDAQVKIWDREGKLARQLGGSPTAWRHLMVSPDGATIVAGGDVAKQQPGIYRWKFADGAQQPTISAPAPVVSLTWAGESRVAALAPDAKLRFYSLLDNRLVEELAAPANSVTLAPLAKSTSLVVAGGDGSVSLVTPSLLGILTGHEGAISSLAWSPDGTELITGGADKTIRRWDAASGKVVGTFAGSAVGVTSLTWSGDGQTLAASTADNIVRWWKVPARPAGGMTPDVAPAGALPAAPSVVRSVRLNRAGTRLAVAGDDALVHLWDLTLGKELERLLGHQGGVWNVAWSEDGAQVISASGDRTVRRWTVAAIRAISAHEGAVSDVRWSPDGKQLATVGADGKVKIWNAADGAAKVNCDGAAGPARSVAWSRDGKWIVAGGDDQTLRAWNATGGAVVAELKLPAAITSLAVGAEARRVIVGSADKTVHMLTLAEAGGKRTFEPLQEGRGHTGAVTRVVLSSDERTATSVGADQTIRRWVAAGPAPLVDLEAHAQAVYGIAFRPDGLALASAGGDRQVKAWQLPDGKPLFARREHEGAVYGVTYHPSGKQLASASSDGSIRLWDEAGEPGARITVGITGKLYALTYSPDGNAVLAGGSARVVQAFHRETLLGLRTAEGHNHSVYQIAYNKAGNRLATLDYSGQLIIWDAGSGGVLFHQQLPLTAASGLAYAPDGTELAVAGRDPQVLRVIVPAAAR